MVVESNQYSIGSFVKIPEKTALVLSLFHGCSSSDGQSESDGVPNARFRINFCSAATLFTALPFLVAKGIGLPRVFRVKGVNERVLEHLVQFGREADQSERGMCLLWDYWETPDGLVELFVGWNFPP